jgi:hypothetical protein
LASPPRASSMWGNECANQRRRSAERADS